MFFAEENNSQILGAFIRKAEAAHIEDKSRAKRLSTSKEIIGYIYKSPEGWDKRCAFNIKHIGDQFLSSLREFDSSQLTHIDDLYYNSSNQSIYWKNHS